MQVCYFSSVSPYQEAPYVSPTAKQLNLQFGNVKHVCKYVISAMWDCDKMYVYVHSDACYACMHVCIQCMHVCIQRIFMRVPKQRFGIWVPVCLWTFNVGTSNIFETFCDRLRNVPLREVCSTLKNVWLRNVPLEDVWSTLKNVWKYVKSSVNVWRWNVNFFTTFCKLLANVMLKNARQHNICQ